MRIQLSSINGWFDTDKCECFEEATWWDGRNHISKPTGSQWHHEKLYKTKSGKWVLEKSSDYAGDKDSYDVIDNEEAYEWLRLNDHFDAVPQEELDRTEI